MSVGIVTQVLNKIPGDELEKVMNVDGLGIPRPLLEERIYSTDAEKNHACADYYVNYHPKARWKHLTSILYWKKEFGAARKLKSFISIGKIIIIVIILYTTKNIFQSDNFLI